MNAGAEEFHQKGILRTLVTVGSFYPGYRGGGPVLSVGLLVDTAPPDAQITVITRDRDIGATRPYEQISGTYQQRGRARIFYFNVRSVRQLISVLREARRTRFDLLYLNSLWDPALSLGFLLAARLRILPIPSILIAPRGELDPGALALKYRKKHLALRILRPTISQMSLTWHASTEIERSHIYAHFPSAHVIVCADETGLPANAITPQRDEKQSLSAVFIGRISPKKNLSVILRALANVTELVNFDIYGPVEDVPYWRACEGLFQECPDNVVIRYQGELPPTRVRDTFAQYHCFIFPTMGENFGHVIAQSLSAACPIICTDTTPWTETIVSGGGVIVDDEPETLTRVINGFASFSADERHRRRADAASAYEAWHRTQTGENILNLLISQRCLERSARGGDTESQC